MIISFEMPKNKSLKSWLFSFWKTPIRTIHRISRKEGGAPKPYLISRVGIRFLGITIKFDKREKWKLIL